jgi:septal ring factor EnvC (AmiA/AmiB activator)
MMERELDNLRKADLNKSYAAQCEVERLEESLQERGKMNHRLVDQIASLERELSALKVELVNLASSFSL